MKKLNKVLAAAFAFALVLASPNMAIMSHAQGFNADAEYHFDGDGYMPDDYQWHYDEGGNSSDSGSSNPAPSDTGSQNSGNHDNGSQDSGNHDSSSSDSGNHDSNSSDSSSSYGGGLGFNANAAYHYDGDGAQPGTEPPKNPNDLSMSTTGGQAFRIVMSDDHTSYNVYHCGVVKAGFDVTDLEKNPVVYKTVALEQGEDNLWYVNITIEGDADPMTSYSVRTVKGDRTYLYTTLGVSGIKVNGVLLMTTAPVEQ